MIVANTAKYAVFLVGAAAAAIMAPLWLTRDDPQAMKQPREPVLRDIQIGTVSASMKWTTKPVFGSTPVSTTNDFANPMSQEIPMTSIPFPIPITVAGTAINNETPKSEQVITPPSAPIPNEPKLNGIIVGKGKSIALVRGVNGVARKMVSGQLIDGWRLVSVNKFTAVFKYKNETRELSIPYQLQKLDGRTLASKKPDVPEEYYSDSRAGDAAAAAGAAAAEAGESAK